MSSYSLRVNGPFRSKRRLFFGVVSGLAEHFAISTLLLRIIVVAISILLTFWPVVIIYLIMVFIMPPESAYRR